MNTKWVVLANTSVAHIYAVTSGNPKDNIALVTTLTHPESRLKREELAPDRPGHYQTRETARGAYSPHMDLRELECDRFAKEIADFLEKNRNLESYHGLILVMAPHFYGLVIQYFHKSLHDLVEKVFEKEILLESDFEFKKYIHELLQSSF
jgi:protein required for attachment to host cells